MSLLVLSGYNAVKSKFPGFEEFFCFIRQFGWMHPVTVGHSVSAKLKAPDALKERAACSWLFWVSPWLGDHFT